MDTFSTPICSKIPPINEEMKNRLVEACLRMLLDTVAVHDKGKAVHVLGCLTSATALITSSHSPHVTGMTPTKDNFTKANR